MILISLSIVLAFCTYYIKTAIGVGIIWFVFFLVVWQLTLHLIRAKINIFGTAVDDLAEELRVNFVTLSKVDEEILGGWARMRFLDAENTLTRAQKPELGDVRLTEAKANELIRLFELLNKFSLIEEKWNPRFYTIP